MEQLNSVSCELPKHVVHTDINELIGDSIDYTNTLSLMYTIEMFKRTLTYHVHTLCANVHTLSVML